jgi:hypothetical protein
VEYCKLKEEALDYILWRTRFGRGYGPIVKTDHGMNDLCRSYCNVDSCWEGWADVLWCCIPHPGFTATVWQCRVAIYSALSYCFFSLFIRHDWMHKLSKCYRDDYLIVRYKDSIFSDQYCLSVSASYIWYDSYYSATCPHVPYQSDLPITCIAAFCVFICKSQK